MADDSDPPAAQNRIRTTGSNFISSIFRRSTSLSEDVGEHEVVTRRTGRVRGFSESSLTDFDNDDLLNTHGHEVEILRHGATTTDAIDGTNSTYVPPRRERSISLSALLLGTRTLSNDVPSSSSTMMMTEGEPNPTSSSDAVVSSENLDTEAPHETTQTDHLNKKLLDSFLTRINSMASNIFDPTGTGNTSGQVYTDDVMMDRILRRIDSTPDSKK